MSYDPSLVERLKELGISENSARYALARTNNDVARAANYVFSGAAGKDEVSNGDQPQKSPRGLRRVESPRQKLETVTEGIVSVTAPRTASAPGPLPIPPVPAGDVHNRTAGGTETSDSSGVGSPEPATPPSLLLSTSESKGRRKGSLASLPGRIRKRLGSGASDKADRAEEGDASGNSPPPGNALRLRKTLTQESSLSTDSPTQSRFSSPSTQNQPLPTVATDAASLSPPATHRPAVSDDVTPTSRDRAVSFDEQASSLIAGALDRGRSGRSSPLPSINTDTSKRTGGALAALGLKAAGVAAPMTASQRSPETATSSSTPLIRTSQPVGAPAREKSRRAPSPFFRARKSREEARKRDTSPDDVGALRKDDAESDGESVIGERRFRPQASAYEDGDESEVDNENDSDEEAHDEHTGENLYDTDEEEALELDPETEKNTAANAAYYDGDAGGLGGPSDEVTLNDDVFDRFGEEVEQDPLGEGPNVVVPPEPLFQQPTMQRKKSSTGKSGLDLDTSRPHYARDRCTITLTHGDPDRALEESGKRLRRYVVLSDLSEESRYAVEWAVGTVARDGDEIFLISVKEDESKVDPKTWSKSDQAQKLRVQKERQTTALLLSKQVTSLLRRTRLHITVTCQFLHAKNARHMLLDLIDFLEPTMVIVGSRGLGKLSGILLGSTSHYLVQKSSVPVMVARRRLQRPLRKTDPAHLRHSPRVSLASASIEKAASARQEDEDMDVGHREAEEIAKGADIAHGMAGQAANGAAP